MTFTVTAQLRVSGESLEAVVKLIRERLQSDEQATLQLEELRIKQATKRGGDK